MSNASSGGGPRVRIGELLVQAGVLSEAKLQEALELQKAEGGKRRLGRLLAEQGFVEETQLTQVLGRQLSVPWVSLYHVDFSRQLLNLVPREVAEGYGVVPVYVRHVRGQGETLYVATDDPTNDEGLRRASAYAGLPVRPMIASSSDIRAAIRVYYGGGAPSAPKQPVAVKIEHVEPPKSEAKPAEPKVEAQPPPKAEEPKAPPAPKAEEPPAKPTYDDQPEIEAKSIPIPPRKKGRRAIALTFLDGTQINLPAPRVSKKAKIEAPQGEEAEELTARDLVSALRAVSHGAEASEILGENPRWEAMFAALLSLLLKKHLIADWEFVEEFRKV
ncbi:MAG: GspE/PulE/PilB domain-containing protein [Polyangiales bacterium]